MNKYLALLIPMLLVGCTPKSQVKPDRLPDAYLNHPYETQIRIINGIVGESKVKANFSDSNFELTPTINYRDEVDYNNLIIRGMPTTLEPITVHVSGSIYGKVTSGKYFEKTYTINVKIADTDKSE